MPHRYCCRQKLIGAPPPLITWRRRWQRHGADLYFNWYPTSWHTPPGCASMLTKLCKMHLRRRRAKWFILDSNQPFFLHIMSLVSLQHTAVWITLLSTVISSYRTKACHKKLTAQNHDVPKQFHYETQAGSVTSHLHFFQFCWSNSIQLTAWHLVQQEISRFPTK